MQNGLSRKCLLGIFMIAALPIALQSQSGYAQCVNPAFSKQIAQVEGRLQSVTGQQSFHEKMASDIDHMHTMAQFQAYTGKLFFAGAVVVEVALASMVVVEAGLVGEASAYSIGETAAPLAGLGTLVGSLVVGHSDMSRLDSAVAVAGSSPLPGAKPRLSFKDFASAEDRFRGAHLQLSNSAEPELKKIESNLSLLHAGNDVTAFLKGSVEVNKAHAALFQKEKEFDKALLDGIQAQCYAQDQRDAAPALSPGVNTGSVKLVSTEPAPYTKAETLSTQAR